MRGWHGIFVCLVVAAGCGRTAPGTRPVSDGGGDTVPDEGATDLPAPPPDARATVVPPAAVACQALKPLADQGLLIAARTRGVHFAPDRSHVVLRVRAEADAGPGAPDRLVRIDLPSGKVTTISDSVSFAEPLGTQGALLVHKAVGELDYLDVYDGQGLRATATGVCQVRATPDGTRLYVLAGCVRGRYVAPEHIFLEAVERDTGRRTMLANRVVADSVAVAPSGQWIAYATSDAIALDSSNTLNLWRADGESYALASVPGARAPVFVSDDLLVFGSGPCEVTGKGCELRGHRVGSGDVSYLIDAGHDFVGYNGYQISPDRSRMLVAAAVASDSATLYAVTLDGKEQRLLSTDLMSYWMVSKPLRPFAFEATGRYVLYLTRDAGVASFDLAAGRSAMLADYADFGLTPSGGSVILSEHMVGRMRLRLVDLASGADRLAYSREGYVTGVTPVQNDRALLFVEGPIVDVSRLSYLSAGQAKPLVLGEWQVSQLSLQRSPEAWLLGNYPVDPTGCFTIVDTDLPPGPGTRLVLLPE